MLYICVVKQKDLFDNLIDVPTIIQSFNPLHTLKITASVQNILCLIVLAFLSVIHQIAHLWNRRLVTCPTYFRVIKSCVILGFGGVFVDGVTVGQLSYLYCLSIKIFNQLTVFECHQPFYYFSRLLVVSFCINLHFYDSPQYSYYFLSKTLSVYTKLYYQEQLQLSNHYEDKDYHIQVISNDVLTLKHNLERELYISFEDQQFNTRCNTTSMKIYLSYV